LSQINARINQAQYEHLEVSGPSVEHTPEAEPERWQFSNSVVEGPARGWGPVQHPSWGALAAARPGVKVPTGGIAFEGELANGRAQKE